MEEVHMLVIRKGDKGIIRNSGRVGSKMTKQLE